MGSIPSGCRRNHADTVIVSWRQNERHKFGAATGASGLEVRVLSRTRAGLCPLIFQKRQKETKQMFDSLADQMKADDIEGTPKEKWTRYAVISAVSAVLVAALFTAV